jgi:hypothetical protein
MTLAEVLCVVVLLSLVAAATWRGVGGRTSAASAERGRAGMLEVDRRARLLARRGEPLALTLSVNGWSTVAEVRAVGSSEVVLRVTLPARIALAGNAPDVGYDAAGRSQDWAGASVCEGVVCRWRVAGLTGWVRLLEPAT